MLARLRSLINVLTRRGPFEREMADEVRFHVDAYARDLQRQGLSPAEAARRARAEFGSVEAVQEDCRRSRGLRWWDELRQDVRYAWRVMRRTPAFTTAVILSLGLGIGATTAIFSLIDAVLLRSLPVTRPDELYFLAHGEGDRPSPSANYPLFDRYRRVPAFAGVTAFRSSAFVVNTEGVVELVLGQYVSGNYHAVVGAPLVLGRGFVSEPDQPAEGNGTAVISESYWERRFGRSPDVLGRTLGLDGRVVSIVGVVSDGFAGFMSGTRLEITLPLSMYAQRNPKYLTAMDGFTSLPIVARLAPGVSAAQAVAAADVAFQQFMAEPDVRWARTQSPQSFSTARLLPAGQGDDGLRHQYRVPLLILIAMAGLVLIAAAANTANMMLARAAARESETAIRLCVGSGRFRLMRQWLTESAVLGLAGGVVGVVLGLWSTRLIVALFATWRQPLALDVSPNLRVLLFTTALALITGLIFGTLPALRMTRLDLITGLKTGRGSSGGVGRGRVMSGGLVMLQVALSVVALATSSLLAQSVSNLKRSTVGFEASNVLLFDVASYGVPLSPADLRTLYSDVLDRVTSLPGVSSASLASMTPMNPAGTYRGVVIPHVPETPDARGVYWNQISEAYFRTIGVSLVQGRTFEARDMRGTGHVAVLNVRAARHIFGDANPVGRTFAWMSAANTPVEVIGVVEDSNRDSLRGEPPRLIYSPLADAASRPGSLQVAVKTTAAPGPIVESVRDLIRQSGRQVVVDRVRTMQDQMDASLVTERALAWLSSCFAVIAGVLACVGLYGVLSHQVAQRTREIGIRLAVGARPAAVLGEVLRGSLLLISAGIAMGLVATWFATEAVSTFLHGLSPQDPATLAGVALGLGVVALVASYLPARRAARIDPLRALRSE